MIRIKRILFFLLILIAAGVFSQENGPHPKMIAVPGGTFMMGSNEGAYRQNERVHEVSLRSFFVSETEVTQELYQAVMKENPSQFKGNDYPVENISWFDAVKFCNALSEESGLPPAYVINGDSVTWNRESAGYRLPTEAEWEYAARGGQNGFLGELGKAGYAGSLVPGDVAWYSANSGRRTQPVKKKLPNELGIYDMSGNVLEWCWDWFDDYPSGPVYDPDGAAAGRHKVFRGGAFVNMVNQIRISFRVGNPPSTKANSVGFRLARNW
ncbi:MAG: formylglycine-generating enzyme family protein [Treponema sp.]|jgi:formylglycine-generating enzyme required for sulfatase activity|nr:formylglycine-generating enzyme family protein [Treponema sp.]